MKFLIAATAFVGAVVAQDLAALPACGVSLSMLATV
jgi:hypothetical protein